mgnify:FL=1
MKDWNWNVVRLFSNVLMILSICYTLNKREMKTRFYEDEEEIAVVDFINAINRKKKKSAVIAEIMEV